MKVEIELMKEEMQVLKEGVNEIIQKLENKNEN